MEQWIPAAMAMPSLPTTSPRSELLADPELYAALVRYARRRVAEHEVEDIVQATLTDALASKRTPETPQEVRRWVHRIARNKIVDLHRRRGREIPKELSGPDEAAAESAPLSARELLRWAEKELPEGDGADSTLEWMLREGDGEKLEHIAEEAELPAPRVRQRVSRMRRHFRSRWAAQLAAVAALTVLVIAALWLYRKAKPSPEDIAREPAPQISPEERGREVRRQAFEHCAAGRNRVCLEELDRAAKLDPAGDTEPRVEQARAAAKRALEGPTKEPEPIPTTEKEPEPAPPTKAPPVQKKTAPSPAPTFPVPAPKSKSKSEAPQLGNMDQKSNTAPQQPKKPSPQQAGSDLDFGGK